jgi:hypothetical protein
MTIPVSTAPAVRAWLLAQATATLTADPLSAASQLLVCLDDPGTYQPDDIVKIGDVTNAFKVNSLVGSGGDGWLEERYSVDVDVEVFRGNDDPQAVSERAYLLAAGVIACVRADPSLGGNVLVAEPTSADYTGTVSDDHAGRIGSLTLKIECYQRI